MDKRVLALFLALIFTSSMVLITEPTQAHFTIGRPTGTTPYRVSDFDPHVPGPTGYLWPGSGVVTLGPLSSLPDAQSGAPTPVTWAQIGYMSPPGYQSPFSTNPPGSPSSWLQLAGNAYAPFGAILTSTEDYDNVGDLVFAINFTTLNWPSNVPLGGDYLYHSLTIYVPPEFMPPVDWTAGDVSNIVTTITNGYGSISVWKTDMKDPFGPGWWVIYINDGSYFYSSYSSDYGKNPRGILFSNDNDYDEWYYLRINGISAPKIAGRYQFKMFLSDNFPTVNSANAAGDLEHIIASTMPVENWPVLLAKGEIDPGIIEGTVRYGAWNQELCNLPIQLPGRVRAVGVADDPYTGASTGRMVEARGYFNASAKGHYEIEGVAPGVYDIYASAAGYPEMKVASGVKIFPGKSFHLDVLLQPGPIITGVVYSKHSFGEVGWPSKRPITIELYDSNEWPAAKPGYVWGAEGLEFERGTGEVWTDAGYQVVDAHLKSFSPINLTDSPFTSYVNGNTIFDLDTGLLADGNTQKYVAFPWEGPIAVPGVSWVNSQDSDFDGTVKDDFGLFNGVGPAQDWWVESGDVSFKYQFGIKGYYGAPMEFDGHIPQVMATWVNGMTAGTYYIRAWLNGYVQTDVSGTYVDYPFTVAAEEWAGDINTPMDLETSSWINKTVHFHDLPGSLDTSPMRGPDSWRYLIAEAYDADNVLVAMNFTQVPVKDERFVTEDSPEGLTDEWYITLNGFGMAGPVSIDNGNSGGYPGVPNGMKLFLYKYWHTRDYGVMPGTYTIRVYMRGYIQQEFESVSISLSQSPAHISNHMYRGAGINVTLYSIDWEHPRVDRYWTFPDDEIRVYVSNSATRASMGYVKYWNAATGRWATPGQISGSTTVPDISWSPKRTKLKYNGSVSLEQYGPDVIGWLTGGKTYYDEDQRFGIPHNPWGLDGSGATKGQTGIWLMKKFSRFGFLVSPGTYRTRDLKTAVALETGSYDLKAYTLGYVQKKSITVYAQKGQQADTKVNLVIGVNITANVKFKKEGIFTHVPYNSSVRIRLFNDNDELSATWYSNLNDRYKFYNGVIHKGSTAYGGYGKGVNAITGSTDPTSPDYLEARNWVRDSTTDLQVVLVGNYQFSENDQYCECPSDYRWSNFYGIDGWPNYQGDWRIEVDVVNWYYSDRSFPAPPGLMLGEGYCIIDGVEGPYGGIWKFNHLGPWEQKMTITVPNAHLGAEASVVFEMDLRGLVSGNVAGFSWSDELRPVSWASITASGAGGDFTAYSWDGYYDMYLPAGDYQLTVASSPGHETLSAPITVSTGQLVTGFSFYTQRTNVPIPEFPVALFGLVTAVGASMYVLRRARRRELMNGNVVCVKVEKELQLR